MNQPRTKRVRGCDSANAIYVFGSIEDQKCHDDREDHGNERKAEEPPRIQMVQDLFQEIEAKYRKDTGNQPGATEEKIQSAIRPEFRK